MRRTSVVIIYLITAIYFITFNARTYYASGELRGMWGLYAIIVLLGLAWGLWSKPKLFWWPSLFLSLLATLLFGYQFYVWYKFILNEAWKSPEVDASWFSFGVVSLLFLSLISLVLLILPERFVNKSHKNLKMESA